MKIVRFYDVWKKYPLTRFYTQKVSIGAIGPELQKEIDKIQRIRPSGQSPKVWQRIEKRDKNRKSSIKFTIQDIPEDRYEDAVQHMLTNFLVDEPICHFLNVKNDPLFKQDISTIWHLLLAKGISIAAFVDNPNGGKSVIASMNVLDINIKNQKSNFSDYQFKSEKCKNIFEMISGNDMIYERYGIDKYITSVGLSVDPVYRGYGLGKDILKVRDLIGPMYGVQASSNAFTSIISQKMGISVGFEELLTKKFTDLIDKNGKEYFPGINPNETFKIMGKRLS